MRYGGRTGGTEREAKGGEMGGSLKTNREKTKERDIYMATPSTTGPLFGPKSQKKQGKNRQKCPKNVVQPKRASGVRVVFFCVFWGEKMGIGGVFAGNFPSFWAVSLCHGSGVRKREEKGRREAKIEREDREGKIERER